jgi:hypothetical protein
MFFMTTVHTVSSMGLDFVSEEKIETETVKIKLNSELQKMYNFLFNPDIPEAFSQ